MPSSRLPSGLLAASLTPLHDETTIAHDAFAQHTEWLLTHGCDALLLFGTTGEGLSLSVEERHNGLHTVLSAGLPPERLLVGTGALALPEAVRLTRRATNRGVGGVLVLPPFHFRSIQGEGVFRFYDQLIQRVGEDALRLYFYHFPELSGVPIPFSVIERLRAAYPSQIAGIKDSSGEWDHTEALCRDFPELQVFTGTERLLLPLLRAGGAGGISAVANVAPPLAAQVQTAWKENESPEQAQERLTRLRSAFAPLPTIPALKHLIAELRGDPDWAAVRPPLAPLSSDEKEKVGEIADRLQAEIDLPAENE